MKKLINNMNLKKSVLYFVIATAVVISLFLCFIIIKRNSIDYHSVNEILSSKSILYDGNYYTLKKNITTYLLMGIDNDGGQADMVILLVADHDKDELFMIPINRNLMTDIREYDKKGNYLGLKNRQVCLAHSVVYDYYDPKKATVEAVSKLLFDVPIDYYVSLDMDGIEIISSIVGDVNVTSNENLAEVNLTEGEDVVVNEDNIYLFLSKRNMIGLGGAQKRLEREVEFLLACYDKFKHPMKNKSSSIGSLDDLSVKYRKLKPYVKTSVDEPLVKTMRYLNYDFSEENVYYIPHKTQLDENGVYEVCYMKEEETKEKLLEVFYRKTLY